MGVMDTQAIREHAKWVLDENNVWGWLRRDEAQMLATNCLALVVRVEELEDWHKRLREWAASHPQLDVPLEFDRGEVNKRGG
jgi:hypothetical protein